MGDRWNFLVNEDSEEENVKIYQSDRDCLVILIDGSESMFTTEIESEETGEKKCLFKYYLEAIRSQITGSCLMGEKEHISIVVLNSKDTKNDHDFKHLYTWIDFELPGIDTAKTIENMINSANIEASFNETFGGREECAWNEAFWLALLMVTNAKRIKFGVKRVWVFTNTSIPGNRDSLDRIKQKIDDLDESDFNIRVFGLEKNGFEARKFWETIPSITIDTSGETLEDLIWTLRDRNVKKRSMSNISFELSAGIELSVGIFNTISKANIPYPVILEKKTNQHVKTNTSFVNMETAEKLPEREMQKAQIYGNQRIAMEKDEVEGMKRITPPGLVLLGFKPLKYLKPQHHMRTSLFLYPDEQNIRGSTTVYRSLLDRCISNEVFAVCRLVVRCNMPPRLVALYPQKEIKSEDDGATDQFPGFYVIFLPFADDIRDLSKVMKIDRPVANPDQVTKASSMIKRLMLKKYDAERYKNPAIEQHYKAVEGIALEWDDRKKVQVEDGTKPKIQRMKQRASREIEEFCDAVFPPGYVPDAPKRKKPTPNVDLKTEAKAGRLNNLTVVHLRDLCSARGIRFPKKARKAEIIEEIKSKLIRKKNR